MDAYTSFAQVYDLFMDNVPYEQWSAFLCRILKKYGIEDGPVLVPHPRSSTGSWMRNWKTDAPYGKSRIRYDRCG